MWDVCNNNTSMSNLSPNHSTPNGQSDTTSHNGHDQLDNKFVSHDDHAPQNGEEEEGFRVDQNRIKPFSPESHYKSQIFMQSVLDLHKSKSSLDLRDGGRNWSPEDRPHNHPPCDLFPRFPISDASLHHRLSSTPGGPLHDRFHHLNGGLMPGSHGGKLHGDLMRYEEKNVSSSTGSHQVKTFRAIRCYHCRMCDQEFVNKSDMQRHAKEIHRMDDKGYKCVKCLKSFPSSQQLAQHSLVHTNVRKYPCRYCDKAFKQLSHVQQHLRIHTGERPYQCAVEGCSKSFRQLSSLQQHIKGHNISLPKSYSIIHPAPPLDPITKDKMRTSLARPTNLVCQICEKHCNNEIRYFQHIHKYHPDFWRVFSSGRPLSDFIDVDEDRYPVGPSRHEKHFMSEEGSIRGTIDNSSDKGLSNDPLLLCNVCKKLFSREAYLLRHLETNKEDEAHRMSLEELRKDRTSFFNAAKYDSGTMVDEIKMETGNSVGGEMDSMTHPSSSSGGLLMENDRASVDTDDVFRKSTSSQNGCSNGDDKIKSRMNSPENAESKGGDDFMQNGINNGIGDMHPPLTTSSSQYFSPSSTAPSGHTSHLQSSPIQHNNTLNLTNNTTGHYYPSSPATSHTSVDHAQQPQQRFDACRGEVLPFSATPSPLYYSFSHHGQSHFFGGRRKSNEAEQLYRRRSEMINPFTSLEFSSGSRDFIGRDLIGRDTMTPFYSPPHIEDRRGGVASMGGVSEEMFGGMGGMFEHTAAAAAGRLISGLR